MKQGLIEQQAWGKTNIIETKLEHFIFLIKACGFLFFIVPTIKLFNRCLMQLFLTL